MFTYEKKIEGNFSPAKIWALYSDVSRWLEWDKEIAAVSLDGAFQAGVQGQMTLKNGQTLPFTLDDVAENQCFTSHSQLGPIKISFIHSFAHNFISHRVEISGAPDAQLEAMGQGIGHGLGQAVINLGALVS